MKGGDLKAGEFKENVLDANPFLTYVVSTHLFIESMLIEWLYEVLPGPDALFEGFRPTFYQLISLCQAHGLFGDDLATILKKLNSLRNKFSHKLSYEPDEAVIDDFLGSFRDMEKPFYYPSVEPGERELALALASLSGYIQRQVSTHKKVNSG